MSEKSTTLKVLGSYLYQQVIITIITWSQSISRSLKTLTAPSFRQVTYRATCLSTVTHQ
ncbi:hypothetical protein FOQG_07664 [Fusarium oxysporum f. sp. raphani 54005]|uniref:Uncharacterized protein n=3 Tax=Fusarium oxysporum TaxID=5507 RepID=X0C595_FUSOX|nr:hypothetical protein FOVG_12127 [Fusarium oxysporum f. sp. pisi HDV247]EXK89575.1 hypothetical protein FOQG_07664 [Fusarium oxysporum f. sp. raphani 54005]EXL70305.1 hypothetical protein FOPG_13847 [Fusarium oxysporum f. sp. conglutinans race 2 54008]